MNKVRPWQGTALGILAYIGMVFSILGAITLIATGGSFFGLISVDNFGFEFGFAIILIIASFLIGGAILDFFIARGLFKGQKWTLIITIVFAALGILGSVAFLGSLIINGAIIGIAASVLKHPFYNQTK